MLMASSKVIASRSPPNSDLPRDSPNSSINIHSDQAIRGFGSMTMNMDEIFRTIYTDSSSFDNAAAAGEAGGLTAVDAPEGGVRSGGGTKTVEEVWRGIVTGGGGGGGGSAEEPVMTLEEYLAKAGAVNEEDVRVPPVATMPPQPPTVGGFGMEAVMMSPAQGVPAAQYAAAGGCVQNVIGVDYGSGMAAVSGSVGSGGRGKRRVAVDEVPLDKATQQKQRRMIKNRESAARSRERKQAYTVELESLVTQLEEENAKLVREEAQLIRERRKQLMKNLIPVEEKQERPPRILRSTRSL